MAGAKAGTVLVTGASRRIGAAIARDLAAHGWQVAIHYRQSAREANALVTELREAGHSATAFAANFSNIDDMTALVSRCTDALGPITCLINNASEFLRDDLASLTDDLWATHMDVNLRAPVFLARAIAAQLPPEAEGNIINIIDQRAWRPTPDFFSYTLSKAALWPATQMLAQALAPRIRVNAIAPGPVLQSTHQKPAEFEAEWKSTLLQRPASPQEIANAVRFILDAPAMTGQMIALDSGQHLAWR